MWVALEWIEQHCVIPDGFRKSQKLRLYEWQGQYLAAFYTVKGTTEWDPVNPVLASAFRFRRGLMIGPQKLGKNPMIATQCCLEGVGPALFAGWASTDDGYVCADHGCRCGWEYAYEPGEPMGMSWPTPLIQVTAFSEDSTENTYDALRPMIDLGPLADVIPRTGEEFIRLPGGGRIDTVTSSNRSRLGQRITFAPQDEVGLWTVQAKMVSLADTQYRNLAGMGGRASLTSNAWDPAEHSVAQREFESSATDVYRQFHEPPKNLSYGDKRERHKIHLLVYPKDVLRENGGHVDLDNIEAEAADLASKDQAQAERFFGNKRVAGAGAAIDADAWDEQALLYLLPPGTYIGLGFDGSYNRDETWLRGCTEDGYRFTLGKWAKPKGRDLLLWEDEHPGQRWTVPVAEVMAAIRQAFKTFRVGRMLADPWGWRNELSLLAEEFTDEDGKPLVLAFEVNSDVRFAPAVDRWRTAVVDRNAPHDGDPDCRDHVLAARLKKTKANAEDDSARYVIQKPDDGRKIDGAVADILALEAAGTMPPDPGDTTSVYDTRQPLTF